ncbi:MAG: hypothetical protein WC933_01940 [Candidatus Paceibacterota bacterium]|jgi:hypothetical protein
MKKKKKGKAKVSSKKKRLIKKPVAKKIEVKEQAKEEEVQKVVGMNYEETLALCRLAEENPDPENLEAVRISINHENINDSEIEYLVVEGTFQRWEGLDLGTFRK